VWRTFERLEALAPSRENLLEEYRPVTEVLARATPVDCGPLQSSRTESAAALDVPIVSVIVPCFNAEGTLDKALRSVALQRRVRWEVIVVDDGSTDRSSHVAALWTRRDSRFRLLQQSNSGAAAARNAGLRAARAEWVCFLDADDWLAPCAFQRLLAEANSESSVVAGRAMRVSADGRQWPYPKRDLSDAFSVLCCEGGIPIHSAIVRKEAVVRVGGFDETLRTSEDWDLWQRLARAGHRFAQSEANVAYYQSRPGSLSRQLRQVTADGLEVMRRGHARDPRVEGVPTAYLDGGPKDALPTRELYFVLWSAARHIAVGGDGVELVKLLPTPINVAFEPDGLGELMASGMADMLAVRTHQLGRRWTEFEPKLIAVFDAVYPSSSQRRLKTLALGVVKARLNGGRPTDDDTLQLDRPRAPPIGDDDFAVLQLRSRRATLGSIALPSLGHLSGPFLVEGVVEQMRKLPLAAVLHAYRPWGSITFWGAMLRAALDPRRLALAQQWRNPRKLRQILRHRLRYALSSGLQASVRARLRPITATQDTDDHGRAVAELRRWALDLPSPGVGKKSAARGERAVLRPADAESAAAWDQFFETDDPWNYGASAYERLKYDDTLECVPELPDGAALELACAEGHFTPPLAEKVGALLATDISSKALEKAAARCAGLSNVRFEQLDLMKQPISGCYDLIVCSEVLYYAGGELGGVAARIAAALKAGGLLVMAHANQISDEPEATGFDWGHHFGSRTIGETFESLPDMRLEREIRRPLYRVQAFRKTAAPLTPSREERPLQVQLEPHVARNVVWDGGESRIAAFGRQVATELPILMYHRVAPPDGPRALDRYRIEPQTFEAQIAHLRRRGFRGVTPETLLEALLRNRPFPGKPVMITFDDGYADFARYAWPVLQRHDFTATMFVVAEKVGKTADWDYQYGAPAPLMSWDQLTELSREGLVVESHSMTHRALTSLDVREIYRETLGAASLIKEAIGRAPISICYPFGAHDAVVERAAQECGCKLGFSAGSGLASLANAPLRLPRVEVSGSDDLESFIRKLGRDQAS
jgi:peptidoglycan/xylan/chitin deacetylase (PgdA/CDA1 family)/2-polyprenyl-3-methyl-5-hydroxy-6-metoxy-1,4-benzoquinol methylase